MRHSHKSHGNHGDWLRARAQNPIDDGVDVANVVAQILDLLGNAVAVDGLHLVYY